MNRIELEERLIDFAVSIIKLSEALPKTRSGITLAGQIVRSGTSPALNYAEAQCAESSNDFMHKLQIELKIKGNKYYHLHNQKIRQIFNMVFEENDKLIKIFVKTIRINCG